MRALLVWDSDYPWDIRVEKISSALQSNGWSVHLVCRNLKARRTEERAENVTIHRLPALPRRLNSVVSFPAFCNPVWLNQIYRVAKKVSPDVIIVRDLPLALAGIAVGRLRGIPVVLDMAECYPEMLRAIWRFEPLKTQNALLRNPLIMDAVEHVVLKIVHHVFAVIEEAQYRLIKLGVVPEKITIVRNTPDISRFKQAEPSYPGIMSLHKEKLLLLYVGFVNYSRGIDRVITWLRDYVKRNSEVFLTIVGSGNAIQHLKTLVKRADLSRYVGFEGWIDNSLVPQYITSADICLVPHPKCSHWDNTIPNKLFDYMAVGSPILASSVNPVARIIKNARCGSIYHDNDGNSFLTQLTALEDATLRKEYGRNGVAAVQTQYNWRYDSERMLQALERVVQKTC